MRRKVIGIVAALILAGVGTVALVGFVRNAEARAQAGEELVEVYVATQVIPAGTPATDLDGRIRVEQVPEKVRATEGVVELATLAGRVAAVDLVPGEQLVIGRFVERSDFANRPVGVVVPEGTIEVTIELEPQRAVGGLVTAGETVAVFASFEPFDLQATVVEVDGEEVALPTAVAEAVEGSTPNTTHLILHKVLVTAVQEDVGDAGFGGDDDERDVLRESPDGSLLVTLALDPADAERLVFTAEFGSIWLASERGDVPEGGTTIQTRGSVYDVPGPVR